MTPEIQFPLSSRKEFITATATAIGASAFGIAHAPRAISTVLLGPQSRHRTPHTFEEHQTKVENDSLTKATRIEFTSRSSLGHGVLIEKDGRLVIYTIEHVAREMNNNSQIVIPDIGEIQIDMDRFGFTSSDPESDEPIPYTLSDEDELELRGYVNDNRIRSLQIADKLPEKHDIVVLPTDSVPAIYKYKGVSSIKGQDLLKIDTLTSTSIFHCKGDSGTPLLEVTETNGGFTYTGRTFGLFVSFDRYHLEEFQVGSRKIECGHLGYVKSFVAPRS